MKRRLILQMNEPLKKMAYDDVAKYIIDNWLDNGVHLTDLIEAFLRADEIACYENAARHIEAQGFSTIATEIRAMKPRQFVFKQKPNQQQLVDVVKLMADIYAKHNKPTRKKKGP